MQIIKQLFCSHQAEKLDAKPDKLQQVIRFNCNFSGSADQYNQLFHTAQSRQCREQRD